MFYCEMCGVVIEKKGNHQKYCKECAQIHYRPARKNSARYSGRIYQNTPDRLEAIRQKYKNGIPAGTIEAMVMGYRA